MKGLVLVAVFGRSGTGVDEVFSESSDTKPLLNKAKYWLKILSDDLNEENISRGQC